MGFFTGYSGASAAIAGLGRLTVSGSNNAPSKDAKRVVRAFVRGEVARGACKGKASDRSCDITSDGVQLNVGDYTLAERPKPDAQDIKVCIPARGDMTTLKSGRAVEAQKSKDVRAAATALLHAFGAGIGVRTDKAGLRRLVGTRGASRVEVPGQCVTVKLTRQQARRATEGMDASVDALDRFDTRMPTEKQISRSRKLLRGEKRMAALDKARAARASKLAAKVEAAARKEAEKHIAEFNRKNKAVAAKGAKAFAKSGRKGWVASAKRRKSKSKSKK